MQPDPTPEGSRSHHGIEDVWRQNQGYLVNMASRMLADPAEAEDVVQEAFGRLARVDIDQLDDARGWLAVVVRRLCLDHMRSARVRRSAVANESDLDARLRQENVRSDDPFDRMSLDTQVQLALAVVLDRLTPAERTAFVLHDVFGFPFAEIGEMVGRSSAACRQLATRARRTFRDGAIPMQADIEVTEQRLVTERFIAACAGGDIGELMAVLDPDVTGEATLVGRGPLVRVEGATKVAPRIVQLFGPGSERLLVPMSLEDEPGIAVFEKGSVVAVIKIEHTDDGAVRHIRAIIRRPT